MYIGNNFTYNTMYNAISSMSQVHSTKMLNSYIKQLNQSNGTSGSGQIDRTTLAYVQGIQNGADDLKASLKGLSGSGAFTSVTSSDAEAMTVKSKGTPDLGETEVKIDQIAKGQVNEGAALKAKGYNFAPGKQQFEIAFDGGQSYRFSVDVKTGDTNEVVQQKMADAINEKGIAVTASVVKDNIQGTSALKIEAKNTGTLSSNSFEVTDVGSGNLIARSEANNISSLAQDAQYSINGGPVKTSKSNDIDLGGGVTATLKSAGEETVKVTTGMNAGSVIGKIQDVLDSYNSLLQQADGNSSRGAQRLADNLVSAYSTYRTSLNEIGVSMGKDGYLHIDEDKMTRAANDGSLERFFDSTDGKNYGFTAQLDRVASQVKNNTAQYTRAASSSSSSLYNDYLNNAKASNQSMAIGMLLNFMI